MQNEIKPIDELATVINALLEQCQPSTRKVLSAPASHWLGQVAQQVETGVQNAAALEAIKAEQKAKGEQEAP